MLVLVIFFKMVKMKLANSCNSGIFPGCWIHDLLRLCVCVCCVCSDTSMYVYYYQGKPNSSERLEFTPFLTFIHPWWGNSTWFFSGDGIIYLFKI